MSACAHPNWYGCGSRNNSPYQRTQDKLIELFRPLDVVVECQHHLPQAERDHMVGMRLLTLVSKTVGSGRLVTARFGVGLGLPSDRPSG